MRLAIFFGICLMVSILFFLYILPWIDRNNCVDGGGVWHGGYCLKQTTPDETLEKLGLLLEEKGENYQIVFQYPFEFAGYKKIHSYIDKRFDRAASEFKKRREAISDNRFMFLKGSCNPPNEVLSFISVECRLENRIGKQYPNHSFITACFDMGSQEEIGIKEVLEGHENSLEKISEFVNNELYKISSDSAEPDIEKNEWIESGTYPGEGNYSSFVLSGSKDKLETVKFMFSPYQIGIFGKDYYEVVVPVEVFDYYAEKTE